MAQDDGSITTIVNGVEVTSFIGPITAEQPLVELMREHPEIIEKFRAAGITERDQLSDEAISRVLDDPAEQFAVYKALDPPAPILPIDLHAPFVDDAVDT